MMINQVKYQMSLSRLFIGFVFFSFLVPFSATAFENDVDDWAAPLKSAQSLLAQKKYHEALTGFKEQADLGNGLAQFNVALFYDLGWGIEPIPSTACQWYQKAADNNIPVAMQSLAQCHLAGHGVKKSSKLAYHWFLKAFEQGIADGGCNAGKLLLTNDEGEIDIDYGQRLCLESAQQGSIFAQSQIAKWYFYGQYFPQDYQKAFTWLQEVASAKAPNSAYLLAQFYDQGIGMNIDEKQALYWYETSATGKFQQAYLPTALLYWKAFTQAQEHKENLLAKSYLWTKALSMTSETFADKETADKLLTKILHEIPESWLASLDKKVAKHFSLSDLHSE